MVTLHAALAVLALSGAGQTVLLDFTADWCGPCRAMSPTVDALIARGYPVQRINLDQNRPLAAKFGVQSIPCFIMIVDGREVDRVNEPTTFSRLERMCKLASARAAPAAAPVMRAQDAGPTTAVSTPASPVVPAGFVSSPSVNVPPSPAGWPGSGAANLGSQPASPTSPPSPPSAGKAADAALIAASVRLRVEDPTGRSCGSGTIIDSRDGEALVLTCGHIFRDSQGKGKIEVDLFGPCSGQAIPGRLISFDLNSDIGLVAIRPPAAVGTARLAPLGYRIVEQQPVVSVGCDNGADPTAQHSQINRLNGFQGAANVEVAGQPVEGRSGGGLFTAEGYVIGVCNAADPAGQQGLFVALDAIRARLDQDQLAFVYKDPAGGAPRTPIPTDTLQSPSGGQPSALAMAPPPAVSPSPLPNLGPATSGNPLPPHEQAALDEIRRNLREGSEVVVVVRPRDNPNGHSEVIVLDHVSPEFLKRLAAERRAQGDNIPVSSESSKPRKKYLEWCAPGQTPPSGTSPTDGR